jgi:hypothetical protein
MEYGLHRDEIWIFNMFCHEQTFFGKTEGQHLYVLKWISIFFSKPLTIYVQDINVWSRGRRFPLWPRNTYFWPIFVMNRRFSLKSKSNLWVLSQKLIFFKTHKHLCTTLKYLTEIEYEPHGDEILLFGLFSLWIVDCR